MTDKFSQYDFVANIIPGILSIFIFSKFFQDAGVIVFNNLIADSIIFVVLAYVVGLIIQFLSRSVVEIPLKFIFWRGFFYSQICLIKSSSVLSEFTRDIVLKFSNKELKVNREKLAILDKQHIVNWQNRKEKSFSSARDISHGIYRMIDAMSNDRGIAKKAHLHNSYYSLLRGLTMVFVSLIVLLVYKGIIEHKIVNYLSFVLIDLIVITLFLYGAKERAERYIKGLFYSIR